MMNHVSDRTTNRTKSPPVSHVGHNGDSHNTTREEHKHENGTLPSGSGVKTTGPKNDIDSRCKNLTLEQLKDRVAMAVTELKDMEAYHHGNGMKYQKAIGDLYWDYSNERTTIGDYLADLGYAEITVNMLKQVNSLGIFKNDEIWFPTYYTYNTCWNYSDASEKLAKCLADAGAVKLMTLNIGHKPYLENMHSKNVYYVLKASLSTLHNIARCTGVKHHFKEVKTAEVVMPLINSSDEFLKSIAMLTLAYIVEEEDNAKLIDETDTIKNIVFWIHKAVENKQKRRFRGFTPSELTQGLSKLAVNDFNKTKIVEEGALGDFSLMLQHTDPKEQAHSAECLWTLAFDKNVRQSILDFPELVNTLESLQDSPNVSVRTNVRGALWMIKGDNDPAANSIRQPTTQHSKNHIFISYSPHEKEWVKKLAASLTAEGYKLWVNWEQASGSLLPAMAEAVENAAVVLICMSEKYKQSPNCRTEAEYTFQLRKEYIPLMMQPRYRPDGWLAAILGAKLFFDFSGKYPYEKPLQGLLKELRGRGKPTQSELNSEMENSAAIKERVTLGNAAAGSTSLTDSNSPSSPNSSNHAAVVASMSSENVENWLVSKGLQRITTAFSQIDGQLIWQLKRMREMAPEYFHNSLERQFGMSLIDILRFNAALDSLQ